MRLQEARPSGVLRSSHIPAVTGRVLQEAAVLAAVRTARAVRAATAEEEVLSVAAVIRVTAATADSTRIRTKSPVRRTSSDVPQDRRPSHLSMRSRRAGPTMPRRALSKRSTTRASAETAVRTISPTSVTRTGTHSSTAA